MFDGWYGRNERVCLKPMGGVKIELLGEYELVVLGIRRGLVMNRNCIYGFGIGIWGSGYLIVFGSSFNCYIDCIVNRMYNIIKGI